jgi:hypothetical protein
MRNAIATVEIFARRSGEATRRLTLVISSPERSPAGGGWACRVALADLHRPQSIEGPDSVAVLVGALAQARGWLDELEASGFMLARDRAGEKPFRLDPELE